MIIIAAIVLGAILGVRSARKQKGRPLDQFRYGSIFGIAFGLVGLVLTVVLERAL